MPQPLATAFTQQIGIEYPLIQAPMAGASTVALAVAVANSGGLGSFAVGTLAPQAIRAGVAAIREQTAKPFNVNLFVLEPVAPSAAELEVAFALLNPIRAELGLPPATPPAKYSEDFDEQLATVVELKVPLVSATFGLMDATAIERLHAAGSLVMGTATNVAEALAWEHNGADFICAQGAEAGGHRGTFIGRAEESMIGTMALVPQVVDAVRLPVIAAGGIMDGRGIAAALALGAQAAQLGTAFLPCAESASHAAWKALLRSAQDTSTRITRSFSGRYARGIVNEYMRRMMPHEASLPPYPVQNALTGEIRKAAAAANRPEYLSLWAGQAAGMSRARTPGMHAAELVAQLMQETLAVRA
ncbi:MAG TPA: nitronate monooxygenase [Burkholderiaceae bacterium]|nr:nitronate monooxygenase [Burkholderiaceae bacterium]